MLWPQCYETHYPSDESAEGEDDHVHDERYAAAWQGEIQNNYAAARDHAVAGLCVVCQIYAH